MADDDMMKPSANQTYQLLHTAVSNTAEREIALQKLYGAAVGEVTARAVCSDLSKPVPDEATLRTAAYAILVGYMRGFREFGHDFSTKHGAELQRAEAAQLLKINASTPPTAEQLAEAKYAALFDVIRSILSSTAVTAPESYIVPTRIPNEHFHVYYDRVQAHFAQRKGAQKSMRQQMEAAIKGLDVPALQQRLLPELIKIKTWKELSDISDQYMEGLAELDQINFTTYGSGSGQTATAAGHTHAARRSSTRDKLKQKLQRSGLTPEHQEKVLLLFPNGVDSPHDPAHDGPCVLHTTNPAQPAGHTTSGCKHIKAAVAWGDSVTYPRANQQSTPRAYAASGRAGQRSSPAALATAAPSAGSRELDAIRGEMSSMREALTTVMLRSAYQGPMVAAAAYTPPPQHMPYQQPQQRSRLPFQQCNRCGFEHLANGRCDLSEPWNVTGRTLMFKNRLDMNYAVRDSWIKANKPVPAELQQRIRELEAANAPSGGGGPTSGRSYNSGSSSNSGRAPAVRMATSSYTPANQRAPYAFTTAATLHGLDDSHEISSSSSSSSADSSNSDDSCTSQPDCLAATSSLPRITRSSNQRAEQQPTAMGEPVRLSNRTVVPASFVPKGQGPRSYRAAELPDSCYADAVALSRFTQDEQGRCDVTTLTHLLRRGVLTFKANRFQQLIADLGQPLASDTARAAVGDSSAALEVSAEEAPAVAAANVAATVPTRKTVTFNLPPEQLTPAPKHGFYQLPDGFPLSSKSAHSSSSSSTSSSSSSSSAKTANKGWWLTPDDQQPGAIALESADGSLVHAGNVLCDTGADVNLMSSSMAKRLGCTIVPGRHASLTNLGTSPTKSLGVATVATHMCTGRSGDMNDTISRRVEFMVVDTDMFQVLLGAPGMQAYGMMLDHVTDVALVRYCEDPSLVFFFTMKRLDAPKVAISLINTDDEELSEVVPVLAAPPAHPYALPRCFMASVRHNQTGAESGEAHQETTTIVDDLHQEDYYHQGNYSRGSRPRSPEAAAYHRRAPRPHSPEPEWRRDDRHYDTYHKKHRKVSSSSVWPWVMVLLMILGGLSLAAADTSSDLWVQPRAVVTPALGENLTGFNISNHYCPAQSTWWGFGCAHLQLCNNSIEPPAAHISASSPAASTGVVTQSSCWGALSGIWSAVHGVVDNVSLGYITTSLAVAVLGSAAPAAGWIWGLGPAFQLMSSCLVAVLYWAGTLGWFQAPRWWLMLVQQHRRLVWQTMAQGPVELMQWPVPYLSTWRSRTVGWLDAVKLRAAGVCCSPVKTTPDIHESRVCEERVVEERNGAAKGVAVIMGTRLLMVLTVVVGAVISGLAVAGAVMLTASGGTVAAAFQVRATESVTKSPSVCMGMVTTFPTEYQHLAKGPQHTKDPENGWQYGNHSAWSPQLQSKLQQLLVSKKHCFAYSLSDLPGYHGDEGPFRLTLTTDEPIYTPKRRQTPLEIMVQDKKCGEMAEVGFIVPCPDPNPKYASAPVIVAKKDLEGNLTDDRFCLDMRPHNRRTDLDRYPMHLPEDLFQSVQGSKYFTKIDLRAGFHQIPIAPEDQPKTAFWWNGQLWMYTRLIFGLKNSPAKFQRVMDYEVQKANLTHCCCSFIDDLLIHSKTAEEHLQHVAAVLDMLYDCGLRAHPGKSVFASETVEYLGHNVSPYGMAPNEAKVQAIKETPNPTNVEGLRSMLGFFNYYRGYVPKYSQLAKPLNALLAKDATWQWGPEQQAAKDQIIAALCAEGRALRRVDLDPKKPLYVHTDWSSAGISAILGQKDDDGNEYMCVCLSRSCNKAERSYSSYEGEMLAAVWGIRSLRWYLHGRPFTLVTDHQPLTWLMTNPNLTGKHARWAMSLMEYEFDVLHRPGKTHQNADFLSRYPLPDTADDTGARLDEDSDIRQKAPKVIGTVGPDYVSPAAFFASAGTGASGHTVVTEQQLPDTQAAASVPTPAGLLTGNLGAVDDDKWATPPQDAEDAVLHTQALQAHATQWVQQVSPLPTDPHTYAPMDLTGGVDRYGAKTAVALHNHPVGQQFFEAAAENGVVLIELFGGMAAGLEMALRNGLRVKQYVYCDTSLAARAIARHRMQDMHAKYPLSFPFTASEGTFAALPQNVYKITSADWYRLNNQTHQLPWLVVAGWECQDLSPAGNCKGLQGPRSSSFFTLIKNLGWIQQLRLHQSPTAYLLENTAFQYNFNSTEIAEDDYNTVTAALGPAITFDAAQAGSYAHRLRHYWTNLCSHYHLQLGLSQVPRPDRQVADILHPQHIVQPAMRPDSEPFYPCNVTGQPLAALPTLVAYVQSRAFRPGMAGAVWNMWSKEWEEPDPVERERALGYADNATAAPDVSLRHRHAATGNCMDANALQTICAIAAAVSRSLSARGVHPPQTPPVVLPAHPPAAASVLLGGGPQGSDTQQQHSCSNEGSCHKEEATMHNVSKAVLADERLAVAAEEEEKQSGSVSEIWEDKEVMWVLQGSSRVADLSPKARDRAARRARSYVLADGVLMRRMADSSLRTVPPPADRAGIIRNTHEITGHFGKNRTVSMLRSSYWWRNLNQDVAQVLGACAVCDRVNASFNAQTPTLSPLPIMGLFYRWGVDLCGPFPETSNGNTYIMVAVEYFSKHLELIPITSKEARNTSAAFLHHILARFGSCAEVVTDCGTEWEGEFQRLLEQCFIDHRRTSPGHPQADGLAERCVQVVKRALRKHCAVKKNITDWDETIAWIALGYRCSKHASTGFSPYMLLYGREPVIPPAVMERMADPIRFEEDDSSQKQAAEMLQERAEVMRKHSAMAGENLRIAQHRDTLRYATVRSGSYQPKLRKFEVGDYVYLRRAVTHSTLQTQARPLILRVVEVKPTGVCKLLGRDGKTMDANVQQLAPCHLPIMGPNSTAADIVPGADLPCEVCNFPDDDHLMLLCDVCNSGWHTYCLKPAMPAVPEGEWICPRCTAAGLKPGVTPSASTVDQQAQEEAAQQLAVEPTFVSAKTRAADVRAAGYEGRLVTKAFLDKETKRVRKYWGRVQFMGATARPRYFKVVYEDGDIEVMGLPALKKILMPKAAVLPEGKAIPDEVQQPTAAAATAVSEELQPIGLTELLEAKEWDLEDPQQVIDIMQMLMPSHQPITKAHAGRISNVVAGKAAESDRWGNPSVEEWQVLRNLLDLSAVAAVADPFTKSAVIEDYGLSEGLPVHKTDRGNSMGLRLQPQRYARGKAMVGMDMVITCPNPKLLDIVVPLMAAYVKGAVCVLVPGHYLTNLPIYRKEWIRRCMEEGRVQMVLGVPKGVAALQAAWLCVFSSAAKRKALLQQQYKDQGAVLWISD